MIINADYIRKFRQVARNISEERVDIFIREALTFDIEPVVGADLMEKFGQYTCEQLNNMTIDTCEAAGLTKDEFRYLCGGTWVEKCGHKKAQEGLRTAAAYFAYARFVRNHATQTTPYGVVVKDGDDSQAATSQMIASLSRDAQVIGELILRSAAEFWKSVCDDDTKPKRRQKHFVAIGD